MTEKKIGSNRSHHQTLVKSNILYPLHLQHALIFTQLLLYTDSDIKRNYSAQFSTRNSRLLENNSRYNQMTRFGLCDRRITTSAFPSPQKIAPQELFSIEFPNGRLIPENYFNEPFIISPLLSLGELSPRILHPVKYSLENSSNPTRKIAHLLAISEVKLNVAFFCNFQNTIYDI